MKRKEHVLDLMQDLHVPKYLRGDEAYQRQKRKREREHEKVKRLRRRWTRSHEYPAPLPTDAPPFPLEGAANVSYSEQRRAWNQMAHAKEWNMECEPVAGCSQAHFQQRGWGWCGAGAGREQAGQVSTFLLGLVNDPRTPPLQVL